MTAGDELMRAARVHEWGSAPVLDRVARPSATAGHAIVRVRAAPVKHFDRSVASGEFGIRPELPYVGGSEAAGTVVDSAILDAGTDVIVSGHGLGAAIPGCWSELVSVPEAAMTPMPPGLDHATAISLLDSCATAWVALHDVGRVLEGETVLVGGAAGSIGAVVVQLARLAGAGRILGEVSDPRRARGWPTDVEVVTAADIEAGRVDAEVDLLVDTVGGTRVESMLTLMRPASRAVLLGYTAGERVSIDLLAWLFSGVSLLPLNMMQRQDEGARQLERLAALVASGEISVEVERHALEDISAVFEGLASGTVRGRAVVEC